MSRHIIFLLLLTLASSLAFSQKLDSLLGIQKAADPREKVAVHFDKNYYNPGETIWFKAYLFTGGEPSEVSRNFYAELIDEGGNVLQQKTAPVNFSGASGHFDLDSSLSRSLVYFRAYTISMLNSDTGFLYTKPIRILRGKGASAAAAKAKPVTTLRFLPEGGDLVAGLPVMIAFLATNGQDLPVKITGTVTDNSGGKAADLKTLHDGMGSFRLVPLEGKTYTATWKDEGGKQYTQVLPAARPQGIVLNVTQDGENKRFTIYRSQQLPGAMTQLHVVGSMNQQLMFTADINMANRFTATGVFPTKELPSGIMQITVFDSGYKPLAERITFVNNDDYEFDGDAFMTQKNLARRGLNQIEVMITDTMPANLSLSVTDADLNEPNGMSDNVITRMLLTGELKGRVSNPSYYFSTRDSASVHLDLLMLTRGWRRYNWEYVLAGKTEPPKWKENNYLAISGKVVGLPPGSISSDLQLTGFFQTMDSVNNFVTLPVDRTGKVFADGLVFYDKAKLFFSFNKKNTFFSKNMLTVDNGLLRGSKKIWLDSALRRSVLDVPDTIVTKNDKVAKMLLELTRQMDRVKVLETVSVTSRSKSEQDKLEEKYVSGLFSGNGRSFDLTNDRTAVAYLNIFQYLQGKVAGLQITGGGNSPSLSWRGGSPALYLNEMRTDASMLSATPVSDIAYIKVFRPGESIVSGGGGGVIAVYTRKGGDVQADPNAKGLDFVQLAGYSPVKEFYSPDYSTATEGSLTDVRTTLYWAPNIYLHNGQRRMRLQFYNNDITKRFRLVMQGINAEGKLFYVEKEIVNTK